MLTLDYARLQQLEPAATVTPQRDFTASAEGKVYGGSLQVQHKRQRFDAGVTFDYIRALQQFPDRFEDEMVAVPWHAPFRFKADLSTPLTENFTLEANWISQWGRKWALRRAYYDFLAFREMSVSLAPFDLNEPTEHSLPVYHRLDLGATFTLPSNRLKSKIQLFVTNVLGRNNVFDYQIAPHDAGAYLSSRNLPGRQFTLSVRVDY